MQPGYRVLPTCNWYFMAASTLLLTGVGWFVTARIIEPGLKGRDETAGAGGGPAGVTAWERRALFWTLVATVVTLAGLAALVLVPAPPLYGDTPQATSSARRRTAGPRPSWPSS